MATEHEHVWVLREDFERLSTGLDELSAKFAKMEARAVAAEGKLAKLKDEEKRAADEAKKLKGSMDGAAQAAQAFGGRVGGAASMLKGLTEGVTKASAVIGPLGGLAAGGALSVAALGFAAYKGAGQILAVADAAVAAKGRLDELGLAEIIDSDAAYRVDAVGEDLKAMRIAVDNLAVSVVGSLSPIEDFVELLTGLAVIGGDVAEMAGDLQVELPGIADALLTVSSGGGWLAMRALADGISLASAEGEAFQDRVEDLQGAIETGTTRPVRKVEELGDALRRAKEQATAAKQATKDWLGSMDKLVDVANDAESDLVDPVRTANLAFAERSQIIAQNAVDEGLAAEAMRASEQRLARDLIAAWEPVPDEVEASTQDMVDALADFADDAIEHFEDMAEQAAENAELIRESFLDAWGSVGSIVSTVAEQVNQSLEQQLTVEEGVLAALEEKRQKYVETLQAVDGVSESERAEAAAALKNTNAAIAGERTKISNIEERQRKAEQAAVAGFYLEQSASLAGVIMNAGEAYLGLLAAMAYLGPGAPVAAAGIVGVAVAAETAAILTADPPSFHDGGVLAPDEVALGGAILRRSERAVVLNERAVQDGGVEAAMALNRGQGGQGATVRLEDAGRVVVDMWLDEAARPSSRLSRYLASVGR